TAASIAAQQNRSGSFAHDHAAPAFRRTRVAQQTPLPISFANKRINLFRGDDETCINFTRGKQIIGQFKRKDTDRAVSNHGIRRATDAENRGQMTRRGIENSFREKERTRGLGASLNNLTVEATSVNNASV